jgi:hypothetical protein
MWAAVIQGEHLAAFTPEQQNVLAEQPSAQQSAVEQLMVQRRHVPAIFQEHV